MNALSEPSGSGTTSSGFQMPQAITENVSAAGQTISNAFSSAGEGISSAVSSVKDSLNEFSSKSAVDASSEFLQSNTILAKFAFLILVLIAFLFLVNLGIMLIGYFTQPSNNPYLVKGTMNAANELVISQDPKNKTSISILRSNNQNTGIEFTWCIWIYVNDVDPKHKPQYQNIFNKGDGYYNQDGIASVNNGPGLYLDNVGSQLRIVMNTVAISDAIETFDISGIPLRKWFHCAIRLENKIMDVYINGVVSARIIMQDVPKQNYSDVNVCKNGGFNGNIADLQYYSRALSVFEINNIVVWGRNTSAATSTASSDATGFPYYLSNLWYSSKY
jgi:Concanavalin A-like lectin/glucanases superfamily